METSLGQRLRRLRLSRGWSQDQEAAAINARRGHTWAPVSRQQVSRWERGDRTPRWETLRDIAAIHRVDLEQLATGQPVPSVGDAPQTEAMGRRDMLTFASASVIGVVAGPADGDAADHGLAGTLDWHRTVYAHLHPKRHLAVLHEGLSGLEHSLLDRSGAPSREVLLAMSEMHLLSGRILFFDLREPVRARDQFALALHAAREAHSSLLDAAALAHASFVYARLGDGAGARELLDLAIRRASAKAGSDFLSWLRAVGAETRTWTGDHEGSLRDIAEAEDLVHAQPGTEPRPPWFDYYDVASFQGFAGNCLIHAGRPAAARGHLEFSLAHLPRHRLGQHSVLHADVALAHVRERDLEAAVERLDQAFDSLDAKWYATGFSRVVDAWNELPEDARPPHLHDRMQDMVALSGLM